MDYIANSINRNIVECKVVATPPSNEESPVLIETLWNVKAATTSAGSSVNAVLIETLWNVKRYTSVGIKRSNLY